MVNDDTGEIIEGLEFVTAFDYTQYTVLISDESLNGKIIRFEISVKPEVDTTFFVILCVCFIGGVILTSLIVYFKFIKETKTSKEADQEVRNSLINGHEE